MGPNLETGIDPINNLDWHNRFAQQANWTQELRRFILKQVGLRRRQAVLEVGCGTGVITADTHRLQSKLRLHGVDILPERLEHARKQDPDTRFTCGDAFSLPYMNGCFDLTICHYLLLWLKGPAKGLAEMVRVTRTGGYVVALAEPDYGARIDYPEALGKLGAYQRAALAEQGADPLLGRKLSSLFHESDLVNIQTGLLGGHWGRPLDQQDIALEWQTLKVDLRDKLTEQQWVEYQEIDNAAWLSGSRVLYVPTFYAWGQVI